MSEILSAEILNPKSEIKNSPRGYAFILGAASLWGTIGIFFTILHYNYGMSALTIGFLRAGIAAAFLVVGTAIRKRDALKLSRNLFLIYTLFGLLGVAFFYALNTQAVI